jgi:hypothetical protein
MDLTYKVIPNFFLYDKYIMSDFKTFNLFFYLFNKFYYADTELIKKNTFAISQKNLCEELNNYYKKINYTENQVKRILSAFLKENVLKIAGQIKIKESNYKSTNIYALSDKYQEIYDKILGINEKTTKTTFEPTISKKEKVEIKEKVDDQKDFLKSIPQISENDFSNNFEEQIYELYELYESQLKIRAFKNIKNNLIIKECLNNYSFEDIKLMLIATRVQIYCEASYKNPCGTLKTIYGNSGVEYDPKSKKNNWLSIQHIFNSDNIEKTLLFLKNIYEMGYSQISEEERRLFNNFMNVNKTTNQEVVEDWKYEDDDEIPIPF